MGINFEQVRTEEAELLKKRRRQIHRGDAESDLSNLFGIALSGGGVRSATINLGILEVFNTCGILKFADYLSTVSGGGYIGGYVQAKLSRAHGNGYAFKELFSGDDISHLKAHGDYLIPGKGINKACNRFRLWGAFLFSVLMNWIWALSLLCLMLLFLQGLFSFIPERWNFWSMLGYTIMFASMITVIVHFFLHFLAYLKLWSAGILYFIEGVLFSSILLYGLHYATNTALFLPFLEHPWQWFVYILPVFIVVGFFANPNIISLHAFYRDRLSETYLKTKTADCRSLEVSALGGDGRESPAPYPLINCCLNMLGKNEQYTGMKTSDYFLLSPLYCGSKLTGYVPTNTSGFSGLLLSTAIAISGAAVNPNMGTRTNRFLAFVMTLLNLRLGYWACNPRVTPLSVLLNHIVWWPYYHVMEMLSKTGLKRRRVNVSDGGHIENLGIYELLRRKCRLIIAVDASSDPNYDFSDLKNLVLRARQELGMAIEFRQDPEAYIRPKPSQAFSDSHFVIADIEELPGKRKEGKDAYAGLLVYVKSSLRPQKKFHAMAANKEIKDSFHYKSFHPAFPHESTVDQFFDKDQWEAYYHLGRYIAADLLGINLREEDDMKRKCSLHSLEGLCAMFNNIMDGGDLMRYYIC